MNQITKTAWDLNEKAPNRYQLVYELIELAKKLVDESQMKKPRDDYGFDSDITFDSNVTGIPYHLSKVIPFVS